MEKPKNEGRFSRLNKFEHILVYLLPLSVIYNVISAFDTPPRYEGTTGALVSSGMDLTAAIIMAGLWLYLFSGRSLFNKKRKSKDD